MGAPFCQATISIATMYIENMKVKIVSPFKRNMNYWVTKSQLLAQCKRDLGTVSSYKLNKSLLSEVLCCRKGKVMLGCINKSVKWIITRSWEIIVLVLII